MSSCSLAQQLTNQMLLSDWALLYPVITGKVTSLAPGPRGTLRVSVSIIKTYKAGRLTITQVGETMSVRLVSQCKKCPLLRRGTCFSETHTPDRSITWHWSNSLLFTFLSDRSQLHYHGSSGWRGTWHPGPWCIHSSLQSPTSETIDEYQQPALLASLPRPGHDTDISDTHKSRIFTVKYTSIEEKHCSKTSRHFYPTLNANTLFYSNTYQTLCL